MTIRGTPAFSDINTYTGQLVSNLLRCLPFLAKVSTLQIQEGNTRTPVAPIPTLRTPDRIQSRRRMTYRLAWSIVCFMTTTAPQENRPTYNYLISVPCAEYLMFSNCMRTHCACGPRLTNVAATCTHQHRPSVYIFVDCRCIITHSLLARGGAAASRTTYIRCAVGPRTSDYEPD